MESTSARTATTPSSPCTFISLLLPSCEVQNKPMSPPVIPAISPNQLRSNLPHLDNTQLPPSHFQPLPSSMHLNPHPPVPTAQSLFTPSTPPQQPSHRSQNTPPLLPRVRPIIPSIELERPNPFSLQPPPEPVLRPLAIPNPQLMQVASTRSLFPRFIVKIGLVGSNMGRIVSKYRIPGMFYM